MPDYTVCALTARFLPVLRALSDRGLRLPSSVAEKAGRHAERVYEGVLALFRSQARLLPERGRSRSHCGGCVISVAQACLRVSFREFARTCAPASLEQRVSRPRFVRGRIKGRAVGRRALEEGTICVRCLCLLEIEDYLALAFLFVTPSSALTTGGGIASGRFARVSRFAAFGRGNVGPTGNLQRETHGGDSRGLRRSPCASVVAYISEEDRAISSDVSRGHMNFGDCRAVSTLKLETHRRAENSGTRKSPSAGHAAEVAASTPSVATATSC
jgi:hypothetical protein